MLVAEILLMCRIIFDSGALRAGRVRGLERGASELSDEVILNNRSFFE